MDIMNGTDDIVYLEGFVDRYGLSNVLFALRDICQDKAEHIRVNWHDTAQATRWEHAANRLHTQACKRNPT